MKAPLVPRLALAALVLSAVTTACSAPPARADFALRPNDRVVFFGDSITEQRNYTRPFQDYVYARYPERHIRFYNAGWGGDVTPRALERLDRDVLALNPTVVTVCFGMNDGRYTNVSDDIVKTYADNLDGIVKRLTDRKIRVILFAPPPVDYDRSGNLRAVNYNENLKQLGEAARAIATKYGATYVDISPNILQTQAALKAQNPGFTMIPDSIHPNETGGVVMAGAMLMGLGAEPMPPLTDATVTPGAQTLNAQTLNAQTPTTGVTVAAQSSRVPLWMSEESVEAARASGFLQIAGQRVRVGGLKAGLYQLKLDGKSAGMWNATQLAAGVLVPGNYSARARRVHDVTDWKEGNYFNLWRNLRLSEPQDSATQGAVSALMQADDAYQSALESLSAPTSTPIITVEASGLPADIGPNLARGKTYQVSDPNAYSYGVGGLTDGSWSGEQPHTFASGDKDEFPKTATIDLGQIQSLRYVWLGVPAFGSTKTIAVSLSSDGQNFAPVGTYVFSMRHEERHLFAFAPTDARYVRLTYPDHYPEALDYTPTFVFTSEVEVFGGAPIPTP